jgi:uncharacterized RDD family membrane protein YckC
VGVLLVVGGLRGGPVALARPAARAGGSGAARLLVMATVMAAYFWLIPQIGMVWASMGAFVATAFLVRTRHPVIAVITALVLPLALFAFFAHVAGVAIPQGKFLELP